MNKKYFINFIRIIIICLFIGNTNYSCAFLWENLWLNLYEQIDKWVVDLEEKNYEYVMWGETWNKNDEINRILKAERVWWCLNNNELSVAEIKEISETWSLEPLKSRINSGCVDENWILLIDRLNQIQSNIAKIDKKYSAMAEEKTKQMFQISNIWIYSDWNLENSWFDLITDIEEINKVIFSSPQRYIWENIMSQDNMFSNFLRDKQKNFFWIRTNKTIITPSTDSYVCSKYAWNSWLNQQTLNDLLGNLNKKYGYKIEDNISPNDKVGNTKDSWDLVKKDRIDSNYYNIIPTWYQNVNDNFSWWCQDNIFCVSINFKVYNNQLLWYWDISIEWLLKKSNEHLKKFAWSYLWQSSMTSWFFECSTCRNLNFGDMFHMWFQVTSKPVPILKLEKDDSKNKEKEEFFSVDNLLANYYKDNCLEYDRANDLTIYRWEEMEKASLNNSAELTITEATKKDIDWKSICQRNNNFIEESVNKEVLTEDIANFYNQFSEVEMHAKTILNYTDSMKSILEEMRKTPVHN